tara:strand:- start:2775 stop:3176 length:402 start_codon:yes stop_codon:yes gene_type:complete
MAIVIYKNAAIFIDGYDLSSAHSDITLAFSSEMQDETTFGDDTRINKGGLQVVNVSGSGFWENTAPNLIDDAYFGLMGTDDKVISLYATGVTQGDSAPGGFAFKGVLSEFSVGGGVGENLSFTVTIEGRGIEA